MQIRISFGGYLSNRNKAFSKPIALEILKQVQNDGVGDILSIKKTGDGEYNLTGDLTIRGITKEISLDATYVGTVVDPYGQTKAGFEVSGKLNRKEFGLKWSAVTEAGSVVVSDEVKLQMSVQFVKES